jgi:hypothetical protein
LRILTIPQSFPVVASILSVLRISAMGVRADVRFMSAWMRRSQYRFVFLASS